MSDLSPWTTLSGRTVHTNPFWEYRCDRVRLPDGREHDYHYVHTPGSVMIVPLLGNGRDTRVVLVRQYRHLLGEPGLELPGGAREPGADPAACARRELREETGYDAGSLEPIGAFNPCKGLTDETCHVFLARDLVPAPLPPDATESFEVVALDPAALDARVRAGTIPTA